MLKWEGFQLGKWNTSVQVILPDLIKQKEKLQILTAIMNLVSASKRLWAEVQYMFVIGKKTGLPHWLAIWSKKWLVSNSFWDVKEAVEFTSYIHSECLAWSSVRKWRARRGGLLDLGMGLGGGGRWRGSHGGFKGPRVLGKLCCFRNHCAFLITHAIKAHVLLLLNQIVLVLKAFGLQCFLQNPKCYGVRLYTQL